MDDASTGGPGSSRAPLSGELHADVTRVTLAPGMKLGSYELAVPVREDDAGSVWVARSKTVVATERIVGLRIASPDFSADRRFRELVRQEVKLAGGVAHGNVGQVLEAGGDLAGGALFVASEWIEGETLADLWAAAGAKRVRIPMAIVLRILADACAGLHSAHLVRDRNGSLLNVVHGDFSGRSIVIAKDGAARVIELGFMKAKARYVGSANVAWSDRGRAPGQRIDRHADVWGVGALLAHLLGDEPVPAIVSELVIRAQSINPVERFATAAEMEGAILSAMMTLGLATSHATVAAFANAHVGERTLARAEAIRVAQTLRPKPPVLSIPTPPVDSIAATVRPALSGHGTPQSVSIERFVVRPAPLVDTSSAISHTPPLGSTARRRALISPAGARVLVAAGTFLAVGTGTVTLAFLRARTHATRAPSVAAAVPASPAVIPSEPAPSPSVVSPPKPGCPGGMVEVTVGPDHDPPLTSFCLDAAPVTTEAYKACSDAGDCKRASLENRWAGITAKERASGDPLCHERDPKAHAREPANCVDREMAASYCAAHGGRLPTEDEATFVTRDAGGKAPASRASGAFTEWSVVPHEPPGDRSYAIGFRCARSL